SRPGGDQGALDYAGGTLRAFGVYGRLDRLDDGFAILRRERIRLLFGGARVTGLPDGLRARLPLRLKPPEDFYQRLIHDHDDGDGDKAQQQKRAVGRAEDFHEGCPEYPADPASRTADIRIVPLVGVREQDMPPGHEDEEEEERPERGA